MNRIVKRAVAASIPAAMLAASTFAVDASPVGGPFVSRPVFTQFGARPNAVGPTVIGGGATLPIEAYLGGSLATGTASTGLAHSLFGYFATQVGGLNVNYCATGSGKAKTIFTGAAGTDNTACSTANNPAGPYGFGASGDSAQNFPTVSGSDAPLATTDYAAYLSTHPNSPAPAEPIEVPSIFGSIAIYYHDNAASGRITVTNDQICKIYTGKITTFGQLTGKADSTVIVPIYRSDGSGTSFNFSSHLANANSAPGGAPDCAGFGANQTFQSADPFTLPVNNGAKGNAGVDALVQATNGGIGYVETGYIKTVSNSINYANVVNPKTGSAADPYAGLPTAANSVSATLATDAAVNQTNAGQGPATLSSIGATRKAGCIKVIPPANYANPSAGYPIVAATYFLLNTENNGAKNAAGLRLLVNDVVTQSLFKDNNQAGHPITTIDEAEPLNTAGTTGYSSLGSGFNSAVKAVATSCILG